MRVVIGLEIHVQMTNLKTKLFCPTPSDYRGKDPNIHVCPVCLGLPGTLPVVNRKAIEYAIAVAKALNCEISRKVIFVRKHYFYPDLPKNYQISQYDGPGFTPIAKNGYIKIFVDGKTKIVRIRRINIEEDPGKIQYIGDIERSPYSLIDYNRSGIALLEIVTEPDMESPKEARAFLEKLLAILEYIGVTDTALEGAFRVDANISIEGGGRVEVKNIGSVKDVERALTFEIIRQKRIIEQGGVVTRETRHWDEKKGVTIPLRSKEMEEDYRYFPDPDLPPILLTDEYINKIVSALPELPDARIERFMKQYGLDEYRASVLVLNKSLADFFEECTKIYSNYKKLADVLITDFLRWVKEYSIDLRYRSISPEKVVKLLKLLDEGIISIKMLKELMPKVVRDGIDVEEMVMKTGYTKIEDERYIESIAREVFRENPKAVRDAIENPKAINFLIGAIMKKTSGRADPQKTREIVMRLLEEYK
ncbi:glutamyl-tRNA(Gln) amidotransferase, B subunit [Ignisphaera aggregans DSM 17230]|uniref:Aspartyl/glutamyl-tRNA(Asn/Gln) amidotransferase subunit B n=1 Tax=Ignisphaera aggregans (strain DSM 17230 / JCM 13409 / AQ1.S1) TaxID=583356 RepID=E0SNS2_IGNAA|nr:glutamyl-tRNA(Gln) amidotransferase, B subunit [Ignisphaera aggregans DSM 17230]